MVYFRENYCFPRFQMGPIVFQGGGGGEHFSGVGVKMLISIELMISQSGGGGGGGGWEGLDPIPLWIRACTQF